LRSGTAVEYNVGLLVAVGTVVDETEVIQAGSIGGDLKRDLVGCVGETVYISGAYTVLEVYNGI
jgi:hypothetical protein